MIDSNNQKLFGWTFVRRILWSVLIGAIIGIAIVSFRAFPVLHQTLVLATSRTHQPVTELYFDNYQHLPSHLTPGKPTTIQFHVTNHMGRPWTYQYQVIDVSPTGPAILSSGTFSLPDSDSTDQTVQFTPTPSMQNSEVIVAIKNPAQHIDFWVAP